MMVFSDPAKEKEVLTRPDIEVFFHSGKNTANFPNGMLSHFNMSTGWYWWFCFPGCLPDIAPIGPYSTAATAIADARKGIEK